MPLCQCFTTACINESQTKWSLKITSLCHDTCLQQNKYLRLRGVWQGTIIWRLPQEINKHSCAEGYKQTESIWHNSWCMPCFSSPHWWYTIWCHLELISLSFVQWIKYKYSYRAFNIYRLSKTFSTQGLFVRLSTWRKWLNIHKKFP